MRKIRVLKAEGKEHTNYFIDAGDGEYVQIAYDSEDLLIAAPVTRDELPFNAEEVVVTKELQKVIQNIVAIYPILWHARKFLEAYPENVLGVGKKEYDEAVREHAGERWAIVFTRVDEDEGGNKSDFGTSGGVEAIPESAVNTA